MHERPKTKATTPALRRFLGVRVAGLTVLQVPLVVEAFLILHTTRAADDDESDVNARDFKNAPYESLPTLKDQTLESLVQAWFDKTGIGKCWHDTCPDAGVYFFDYFAGVGVQGLAKAWDYKFALPA